MVTPERKMDFISRLIKLLLFRHYELYFLLFISRIVINSIIYSVDVTGVVRLVLFRMAINEKVLTIVSLTQVFRQNCLFYIRAAVIATVDEQVIIELRQTVLLAFVISRDLVFHVKRVKKV